MVAGHSPENNSARHSFVFYTAHGCSTGFAQCALSREPLTPTAGHGIETEQHSARHHFNQNNISKQ